MFSKKKIKAKHQNCKGLIGWFWKSFDKCHMEFAMQSQSNMQRWYIVNLSREWYECDDYMPICKHMWALKMIVEEEFHICWIYSQVFTNQMVLSIH